MSNEHQKYDLQANIQKVLAVMQTGGDGGGDTNTETDEEERETIHVYPVEGGGILLTRTPIEPIDEDLDTAPLRAKPAHQPTSNTETGIVFFQLFVILTCLMCIMVQCYLLINPFTVTVTLTAKEQQVSLTGTLPLGRVLNPITVSQSQIAPTTGRGHKDAKQATGYITFYNGSNVAQTINAGTVLTGQDGVQVVTDQTITVPAANLPQIGVATVSAHAINAGSGGNIQAGDINPAISSYLVAKNQLAFSGGQDERDYMTVTKNDIAQAATPLKATLAQSVNGALQGQLKANEGLVTPSCTTSTAADHQIGQEATQVKVTVSETCSGVAYNQDSLQAKVTQFLTAQETTKLGAGYSILGNPQITITQAIPGKQVTLSFTSVSTWIYALSSAEQPHIKKIIAGKNTQEAMQLLTSLPGIEHVSLQFSGFGDDTRLPKDISYIHLLIIYAQE